MTDRDRRQFDFPTQTVRGRLLQPVPLTSPDPSVGVHQARVVAATSNRYCIAWPHTLIGIDDDLGELSNVWPKGSLTDSQQTFPLLPVSAGNSIIACPPQADRLEWLYPATLQQRTEVLFRDIEALADWRPDGKPERLIGTPDGNAVLLWRRNANDSRILLIREDGQTRSLLWNKAPAPSEFAIIDQRLLVLNEGQIALFDWERSTEPFATLDLPFKGNRLWGAPTGRHALVADEAAGRLALIRFERSGAETDTLDPTLVMQGMILEEKDEKPGGWLFWERDILTKLPPAQPMNELRVAFSEEGHFIALGDARGRAALLSVESAQAVSLMTPPESAFYPLNFDPPNRIRYAALDHAGQMALDWDFADVKLAISPDKSTEEPSVADQTSTSSPQHQQLWLLWALAALAAGWLVWFWLTNPA